MKGFFSLSSLQKERSTAGMVPRCGACGLYKQCQSPKMKPFGRGGKGVLIVGEAPGETEDERGRPFVGKAGQFLRDTLEEINVDMDKDAITTNSLICRPPGNKIADPQMIDYCRPNLSRVIEEKKPTVILTLGRSALASVLLPHWKSDLGPLERWIGWTIPLKDFWVCPTWHPSYLLRLKDNLRDRRFKEHLKAAFEFDVPPESHFGDLAAKVQVFYDQDIVYNKLMGMADRGGWHAFDYETNCLKPELEKARIVSAAVCNGRETIAFPWTGQMKKAANDFLHCKKVKMIASNLKFEDRWTRHFSGDPVANWGWDTMLAAHCLDNRPGICSLKFQALVNLGVPSYNSQIEPYLENYRGQYNRIHEISMEDLLVYNGIDAFLEYKLAMKQRELLGYED